MCVCVCVCQVWNVPLESPQQKPEVSDYIQAAGSRVNEWNMEREREREREILALTAERKSELKSQSNLD